MLSIRYVQREDKDFWYRLDRHLPESEFEGKVSCKRGYVLLEGDTPIGLLNSRKNGKYTKDKLKNIDIIFAKLEARQYEFEVRNLRVVFGILRKYF